MTMWLVRAGKSGEKELCALRNNVALIGWEELPDLTPYGDRDAVLGLLQDTYPTERRKTHTSWQNQIWPIRDTMQVGDLVALPLKMRSAIAFGTVSGDYAYRTDLLDGPQHTRPVKWQAQVPRSEFDPDMLFSFGAFMTVCRIARNDAEQRIRAILQQEAWPAADVIRTVPRPGSNLRAPSRSPVPLTVAELMEQSAALIRDRIAQRFKGHRLAELVAALLETQGFHARLSPPGADGGVDILAGRGPFGLDPPRLVVQVKSQDSKLDVRVLRELSGVMSRFNADQGLLVGWGGFNQTVRAEALADYFRVRLWDADDLVRAVEKEYGRLPTAIRAEIPLKQVWALAPEPAAEQATARAAPVRGGTLPTVGMSPQASLDSAASFAGEPACGSVAMPGKLFGNPRRFQRGMTRLCFSVPNRSSPVAPPLLRVPAHPPAAAIPRETSMPVSNRTVDLDANEVALIVGEEDGSMTVRVVPATELPDGAAEIPEPYEIAVALAMRLLNDPDFHDDVLEWYESQDDDAEDDEDEDEVLDDEPAKGS